MPWKKTMGVRFRFLRSQSDVCESREAYIYRVEVKGNRAELLWYGIQGVGQSFHFLSHSLTQLKLSSPKPPEIVQLHRRRPAPLISSSAATANSERGEIGGKWFSLLCQSNAWKHNQVLLLGNVYFIR
ncbi:hypothetical protein EZV62_027936 [Acer yangbiense]|uniref:Uncharacterized protein n=1 Tax=Acer yangbiense TaxID=1000413 RepID=A0A5C7GQ18_9ROSI|nr:hypothetical protein EZV62_027936 [Acer yangbiense]